MCLIDLPPEDVGRVAELLDGFVFGFSTAVVFLPLSGDFSCQMGERIGGGAPTHPCSCWPDSLR